MKVAGSDGNGSLGKKIPAIFIGKQFGQNIQKGL
jgi:hypothetical protein